MARPLAAAAFVALAGLGCGAQEGASQAALALEPCRLQGLGRMAECGRVEVPEDRADAGSRRLALSVIVVRARGGEASDTPLFMLAGGPGQAASMAYPPFLGILADVTRKRNVVLVDMRGSGRSAALDCPEDDDLQSKFRHRGIEHLARRCAGTLSADLSQYTTAAAVADLDAVRAALGAERIDLFGASYGTRLGLAYASSHPQRVRAMVLDAVAPSSLLIPLPLAADGQAAFDGMVARCAADPACAEAFPDPAGDLRALLEHLAEPRTVVVRHPRSGETVELTLTRDVVAGALRGLLYSPELVALIPLTLKRARAGDWDGFVAQALALSDGMEEAMSMGLFLSVVCHEDVPRIADAAVDAASEGTFLGRAMVDELRAACALWPQRASSPQPTAAAPSGLAAVDMPVLLTSGELDPVTPPRWAAAVASELVQARHLVVPGAGHGVVVRSCVPDLMAQFLEAPEALDSLDASCIADEAPSFFIDFSGPRP